MKKLRKYLPFLTLVCFVAVVYMILSTTVHFKNLDENEIKEVAYLTIHNTYRPLPEEERQLFIATIKEIKTQRLGLKIAMDGGTDRAFRLTLEDGTEYFLSVDAGTFTINGRHYRCIGDESMKKGGQINSMFSSLPDHIGCG